MDVAESCTNYVPVWDGVPTDRERLLRGAIVCTGTYIKGTVRVSCAFCHDSCYRLVSENPADYINVCLSCLVKILGPPRGVNVNETQE